MAELVLYIHRNFMFLNKSPFAIAPSRRPRSLSPTCDLIINVLCGLICNRTASSISFALLWSRGFMYRYFHYHKSFNIRANAQRISHGDDTGRE